MEKQPKCKNCWDKGFSTQYSGIIGSPDFPGDKGFEIAPSVHKNYCTCDKGQKMRMKETDWKPPKPNKGTYIGGGFIDEDMVSRAAEGGARLQKIQMIVWDYMRMPKRKRDGIKITALLKNYLMKNKNMITDKNEEKQKDAILQQINDALESEEWGGRGESLILELAFERKYDCQIRLRKKLTRKI